MLYSNIKLIRIFIIGIIVFLTYGIVEFPVLNAQSLPDISSINVDDLSDAQLEELVRRAMESGLSESELLQMAKLRGVPTAELEKLRKRLEDLDGQSAGFGGQADASKREPRRQMNFNEIAQGLFKFQEDMDQGEDDSRLFGMDLFYNKDRKLTFEPNLNLATPKTYILGAGDMLYIDIYGQS